MNTTTLLSSLSITTRLSSPKTISLLKPSPLLFLSPWNNNHPTPTLRLQHFKLNCDGDDIDFPDNDYDFDMEDDDIEEIDNKTDYDVDYDHLVPSRHVASSASSTSSSPYDIDMSEQSDSSLVLTQGSDWDSVIDYKINEDEFHRISLYHCDFFVRRGPDPDNNVFDFREMYVSPPDTDVYSIPRVLAPMPQKYIRCSKTDFGSYNVTEPTIDAPRDPLYKSEKDIMKVFLTKHYRNIRANDPEFLLDLEEIYVIDSKSKSITRAKVLVTVPGGRNRDRKNDLLIIRDGGNSFKITDKSNRADATTVIAGEEWAKSRQELEKHLRKLRDFDVSNWF